MDYIVEIVEKYDLTYSTATKICITLRCKKNVMGKGKSMTIYTYPTAVALSPHRLVLKGEHLDNACAEIMVMPFPSPCTLFQF